MLHLDTLWSVIIAILWVGFFVLEGFDFGVGVLHTIVGRTDAERRDRAEHDRTLVGRQRGVADRRRRGHVRGVPRLVRDDVLGAVPRAVARARRADGARRRARVHGARARTSAGAAAWTWCTTLGSLLIPLLLGVGLGDLLNGLPIDSSHDFTGNFFDLLTAYGLWTGVTLLGLCLLHGATFLKLRTTGEVRERAGALARPLGWAAIALVVGFVIWTRAVAGGPDVPDRSRSWR